MQTPSTCAARGDVGVGFVVDDERDLQPADPRQTETPPNSCMTKSTTALGCKTLIAMRGFARSARPVARCVGIDDDGRWSDSLPGSRTFDGSSCATSDSPRTFSGCYTSLAG